MINQKKFLLEKKKEIKLLILKLFVIKKKIMIIIIHLMKNWEKKQIIQAKDVKKK